MRRPSAATAESGAKRSSQARETLGRYWSFIEQGHVPYIERRFKVKLTSAHYRLIYYDAKGPGGPKLVLQFVNGQYTIP